MTTYRAAAKSPATADRKAGLDVREYALYAWGAYVVANGSPPPR